MFDADELETVDKIVQSLWGMTAEQVSDLSHHDPGWKMLEELEVILFEVAYLPREVVLTDEMRRHAAELAARLGRV